MFVLPCILYLDYAKQNFRGIGLTVWTNLPEVHKCSLDGGKDGEMNECLNVLNECQDVTVQIVDPAQTFEYSLLQA